MVGVCSLIRTKKADHLNPFGDLGAPGPDRVVINGNSCAIAGVMTHTGARGNSFVLCR